jgi:hypothetical protein
VWKRGGLITEVLTVTIYEDFGSFITVTLQHCPWTLLLKFGCEIECRQVKIIFSSEDYIYCTRIFLNDILRLV